MSKILLQDLKDFCCAALVKEGMSEEHAATVATVLAETDAFGTNSHGTKNLHNYIRKFRAGGADIKGETEIVAEGPGFAVIDAHKTLGMIPSVEAMELACEKAATSGIAMVTVRNSCHYGSAGYYVNIAAKKGYIGLAMSNVDPNMTVPGAKGMVMGNNPFAYAAPSHTLPSVFLDIAMSNVASLKVVQARKDGKSVPPTWIVDKEGVPTTDPSHYPEEGAMQPMAAHKGYGLAIMVELLTGIISGGCTSMGGDIVSWCFEMDKPNQVCHTFIALNPELFLGTKDIADKVEDMAVTLHEAPKAKGSDRIYTPGEMEWEKYKLAVEEGLTLSPDVEDSLKGLSQESGIPLKLF